MQNIYEKNAAGKPLWKKALCIFLSVITAFGTFVTITVGSSRLQDWLGIKSMLSAYAAEIVETKGAVAVSEETMLADSNIIELENKDGSNTLYLFSEPISYEDENGNLKTKDISVEKQSDKQLREEGYRYTNGQNDYRINFSEDSSKGIYVQFGECTYSVTAQSDYQVSGKESVSSYLNRNFEVFEYNEIYGTGTSLKFYPQLNGVKDEIILNSNIGKNSFSFKLETENCKAVLNDDGTVSLISNDDESEVQTFAAPFAYDSEYVEGDKDEHYINCVYTLKETAENSYVLTVSVDENWLNSSSTVYPVVIDPTTSNISNYSDSGLYSSASSRTICYGNEATCCFGRTSNSEFGYGRVLNFFYMPSEIKKGAVINSAYLWERETTGRTTTTYVAPCMVSEKWYENRVTWENSPGYYPSTTMARKNINSKSTDKSGDPYWYKFDVVSAVRKWNTGTANNGLLFKSSEEDDGNYYWRAFASRQHSTSAYRPYTVINYTNDTTAPTIKSVTGNPTAWTNGNVTLTVNGAADNSGGAGLHSTAYSFSTTKGSYSWQAANTKTFTSNCTVYIYVRDALGNIALRSTVAINKIDKTKPSAPEVTGNADEWTNADVTLSAGSSDTQSGVAAYSFSTAEGAYAWQTDKTKTFSENTTVYVYAKDNAGNISDASIVEIGRIDKTAPTIENISVKKDIESKKIIVQINAIDTDSGGLEYSFDNGKTYQTSNVITFDNVPDSFAVAVRDRVGNTSTQISETVLPEFYNEGNLIGIFNPNADVKEKLEYKIGENGDWVEYKVPFAVSLNQKTTVYARISGSYSITEKSFEPNTSLIGVYTESNTDFTFSYRNISFDFVRTYKSIDRKWFFAIDSNVKVINDYVISAVLPDNTELTFIKTDYNTYTNEINGYTLVKIDNGYIIQIEDINYTYDAAGRLSSVSNKYDDKITISREKSLITITDDADRTYSLVLDSNGNIISVTDPVDNIITYVYDDNNLVEVIDQAGVTIGKYLYENGVLVKTSNKTVHYNSDGKISRIQCDNGLYTDYSYDLDTLTISTETEKGITASQTYNDAMLIVSSTDNDGIVSEYIYDDLYNLSEEIVDGITVNYTYDDKGNMLSRVSEENSDEEKIYNTYDNNGNLIVQQTGDIYKYYVYNSQNDIIISAEIKEGYEGEIPQVYDETLTCFDTIGYNYNNGLVISTVDSKTNETNLYNYDDFGNNIKFTQSTNKNEEVSVSVNEYTYDLFGNVLTTVINNEEVSSYIYDKAGRMLLSNENGDCNRTLYDDLGRVVQEISSENYNRALDGLPQENIYNDTSAGQTYVYDNTTGNLASETNSLGVKTSYTYFENSDVVKTESFDIYVYEYNENGDVINVSIGGNIYAEYIYNDDNLLTDIIYGNGQFIHYDYNVFNQIVFQKYKSSENVDYFTQFEYVYNENAEDESASMLLAKYDYSANQKTVYGEDDLVTIYNFSTDENGKEVLELYYSYIETCEETEDSNDDSDVIIPTVLNQTFSDDSVLTIKKEDNSNIFMKDQNELFRYNLQLNDDESVLSSSVINTVSQNEYSVFDTVYSYNEKGYIESMTVSYANGSKETSTYAYDENGNVTEYHPNENGEIYYTYDLKNQLVREDYKYESETDSNSGTAIYEYDNRGNLKSVKNYEYTRGSLPQSTESNEKISIEYENGIWLDEITSVPNENVLYDDQGNLIKLSDCDLHWINGRQLSTITYENEQGETEEVLSYTYDENGIRTSKTLMGVTTYFTTINGNITSQYTIDENGARTDEILFLYDDNNEILGAVLDNEYVFYYTKNAMGDVTGFADADGNRISEYYFNAWGEIIGGSRNIGSTLPYAEAALKFDSINPIRYKGYYYDDEFGMYYLQSRYYMPSWCRFINADLPEYAQMQKNENAGVNLFAYCCNDPVNNVDIRGTWAKAVHSGFKSKGNYYSVVSNGKRYYYGTYYWAIRCGFNYHCAEKLAKYCQDLDVYYSSTLYSKAIAMNGSGRGNNPIYSPQQLHNFQRWQYWHFNEYTSMGRDSRKEYAERRLKDAIYWWNKNYARSLMWLGYGLHAIQDVSAHGQIGAGAWIPQHIYLDSRNKTLFTSADSVQGFVWSNGKRNGLIYLKGSVVRLMEAQRDTYDYLNRFLRAIGKKR